MSGTLFEHALRLHRQHPDAVLPRDGYPYPDEKPRRRAAQHDQRLEGADVAAVLDRHFSHPDAHPSELDFSDCRVPIHPNQHIAAAALRADRSRVRRTGRWLVRHSTERDPATVGLALLATDWSPDDVPLIQTIGLLSHQFGPLAVEALKRRQGQGLLWLAQRVGGWGRVYAVEALCRQSSPAVRSWLLRHSCDGDFLNGYFAGEVATAAHLHEAITAPDPDEALIDHTGRLLKTMSDCEGVGLTLRHYPPAPIVLNAHAAHLANQPPNLDRYVDAALIADHLADKPASRSGCTPLERDQIVRQYLAVLNSPAWTAEARAELTPTVEYYTWFTTNAAARLNLHAFGNPTRPSAPDPSSVVEPAAHPSSPPG